jgi:membrane protein DedA with SNARE-associated domain
MMTQLALIFNPLLPYLAILAALLASGIGAPIPEEVTVVTAGILAAHGAVNFWLALGTCWVGALLGDCCWYFVGYHFGKNILREHHLWTYVVTPKREARMEELINRHGLKVLFAARFLVGIRSAIYLASGILRVRFRRFLLTDLFAATVVVGTFYTASYRYGPTVGAWLRRAEVVLTVVVLAAVAGAIAWFWRRRRRKRM